MTSFPVFLINKEKEGARGFLEDEGACERGLLEPADKRTVNSRRSQIAGRIRNRVRPGLFLFFRFGLPGLAFLKKNVLSKPVFLLPGRRPVKARGRG